MQTTRFLRVDKEIENGIVLRPSGGFRETTLAEVVGCLRSKRRSNAPAQTRSAITREVRRRHESGRY
jgi:hypothetical protein